MENLKVFQENMSQNSYVVVCDEDAIIIDAGASVNAINDNLKMFNPRPSIKAIFLTHSHFDHIQQLDQLVSKYKCPVYINKLGKQMLYDEKKNLSYLDTPFKIKEKKNIKTFVDGDIITIGNIEVKCFNTPGHSIDSSCFVIEDNMFTGDTIFKIEVGRTDMYSGDEFAQKITLERILNVLSEDVKHFYPGHGPNFDIDDLKYNIERILGDE